jgi:predicted PurR-regulated permease PerM
MNDTPLVTRSQIAAWLLTAVALFLVLHLHLLPALLAGLLVFELIVIMAPWLQRSLSGQTARTTAVALLALLVIAAVVGAAMGLAALAREDAGSAAALFGQLAELVERARQSLPSWISSSLPDSATELHEMTVAWLKAHAAEVQGVGKETARGLAHLLIGMAIGGLAAIDAARVQPTGQPLVLALTRRIKRLSDAFRNVVFAQIRISLINTTLTALFLALALPLAGIHLPLIKTMILVTFLAGLIPVIGNLLSNTLIVVVALSHSPDAGLIALIFLVVIHKLEYFLNARIVGVHISARAWELLAAMLVMEAAFGLSGLVAAPIYYAYLKDELTQGGLL